MITRNLQSRLTVVFIYVRNRCGIRAGRAVTRWPGPRRRANDDAGPLLQ